jgi:hypothetical protein
MNYRNTGRPTQNGADAAFEAMQRHAEKLKSGTASFISNDPPTLPAPAAGGQGSGGDRRGPASGARGRPDDPVIYGAMDIAAALFGESTKKARRRVYNIAAYHRARKEQAGFFKVKGALCLSMCQWRRFHGLDQ